MDKKLEKALQSFREQSELMEDKVNLGIETNRKGYFRLNFIDENGEPVTGAKVTIRQKTHDFKFGCNLFKLGCFEKDEDNAKYEECFADLFNMATIPLYWSDFEPENGKPRFEKDSPFIDRRVPPETALEFCKKHNIEVKGHPLFWHVTMPDWLPSDFDEMKEYWMRRLEEISSRYDGVIKSFDCINEVDAVPFYRHEPRPLENYRSMISVDYDFPWYAFDRTAHYFKKSKLVLNEASQVWKIDRYRGEASQYYLLCKNLLDCGKRVDTLGFQYHAFNTPDDIHELSNDMFNPSHLYRVMNTYSKLQLPMSVTEITLPGYDDEMQAELFKNLYRIWFSSPNMESIIYWNLGDNCAACTGNWSEDVYKSGLVRADFSKKPSYFVLKDLIKQEWQTNLNLDTNDNYLYFKAFYGNYEITAEHCGKTVKRELHLSKNSFEEYDFRF